MTELALQKSTEHDSSETIETERSLLANQFHESFINCLITAQSQGFSVPVHHVDHQDMHNGLKSALDGMARNDARYIQVFSPGTDRNDIRHILALQRESGDQAILTVFQMQTIDEKVQHAKVFQEIADEELNFNSQLLVECDPNKVEGTTLLLVANEGEDSLREQNQDGVDCLQALEKITNEAIVLPLEKVVTRSVTSERDKIKSSSHKKNRVKALGATIRHIPEFYKQERSVA